MGVWRNPLEHWQQSCHIQGCSSEVVAAASVLDTSLVDKAAESNLRYIKSEESPRQAVYFYS